MSRQFADHLCDMLSPLGPVTARAMFGGFGLYLDGLMFALIAWDCLFMKADDGNRAMFEAAGAAQFKPWADKPMVMPYWEVPADVVEDGAELCAWGRAAFDAALRTHRPKRAKPSHSAGKARP
ncbi:competence-specific gene regulator [Paramagnetospirillum caucaseum]|uniref:Competence-specific gene regulator n=1 Tax=Paramagnetospirillum caucaseum TaxID=1244869 RepID=M3AHG8_9PROT|nr:TfoX/Sxy family protein [Paramagnetospirillum caucaseum]EME71999.1 competence-specific gene regulator [Paramagnetospirillum caucaseum]